MPLVHVPPGWKLVPVEPTDEMIASGYERLTNGELPPMPFHWEGWITPQVYRDMVAASPSPPQPETGRDAKDYAIEFGGYLATAADRVLNAINEPGEDNIDLATAATSLRSAIHEFRKRKARAPQPETESDEATVERVDRVARAMCRANLGYSAYSDEECNHLARSHEWQAMARAAIAAINEPSPAS